AVFRRYLPHFLLAVALFAVGATFGFGAAWLDPAATGYLLPRDFPMIQPGSTGQEESSEAATTGQLVGMSGFLFRNNVTVSLLVFGLGITFGVGTVWLLISNGLMLGALAAVFVRAGAFRALLTGVLPHGVLEIPAALIGGAAGLVLAQGLIQARPWPRLYELARCGKQAVFLVSGCLPLLAVAAILEAVVARAPNRFLSEDFKLATAAVAATLFIVYLVVLGRGRHAATAEEPHAAP
ncbi:MAG TPA: stage II sporulation protein M, partial [Gemmataceae bacterium]|nr:stage II sporulation protein M [Gemmataceae bacterium]